MKLARLSVFLALPLLFGCNSFERNTFNSLAASDAVIDQAQVDYTAGKIKQTSCTYAVINDAKAAQTTAVTAFALYESNKSEAQEQAVLQDISAIVPLVAEVKVLYTNPSACVAPK